jgi:hypothetical protein
MCNETRSCDARPRVHSFLAIRVRGYVLDIGPKFFLLALLSDRIWFDAFECFRINDVKDVGVDPYAT